MFPSSNGTYNPHVMPGSSFSGDKHPAGSSLEDHIHTPPFLQFHAPFFDNDDEDDVLFMSHLLSQSQQQILGSSTSNMAPPDSEIIPTKETKKVPTNRKRSTGSGAKKGIPRKRTGKKDRHSKIYTAHGPRDRRMRLSLQIARKFFDLQDMLGFDKASKTIEWLFSESKAAIKELTENPPVAPRNGCSTGGRKSVSSTSESEVVSAAKCQDQQGVVAGGESMRSTATARVTKERKPRKASLNRVPRESRDKARARARERTREKMKMKGLEKTNFCSDETNPNELKQLQSGPSTETNNSLKLVAEEEHQMDYVSTIERFLGITGSETCQNFSGNWSMSSESYCAMTSIKNSTGNTQEQNPSIIFMTDPNSYSKIMNHNSDLVSPSNAHEGRNPTSFLTPTSDIGLHSDYQENPALASKFHNFY
ncbi:hypothetical protein HRI_003663800 [Hibiscus trionum]|uniref:Uncharacterized protein n=1 Tax=Hibiscus trionum TaxID=183268 RepID=A0A9W7IPK8_HIBTR|nr:hypothetical protein HRI_003663800 [Hibiscus trionum]